MKIDGLFYYPIKGFHGIPLSSAHIHPQYGIPNDRRFAFTQSRLDLTQGWQPWATFLTLKTHPELAQIKVSLTEVSQTEIFLDLQSQTKTLVYGHIHHERKKIEDTLADYLGIEHLQLVDNQHHPLWDEQVAPISLVNAASVTTLFNTEETIEQQRFRSNIVFSGIAHFEEEKWQGDTLQIGPCRLKVIRNIPRCAATVVNPQTSTRDRPVLKMLQQKRQHTSLGIYAHIEQGGHIKMNATINNESTPKH